MDATHDGREFDVNEVFDLCLIHEVKNVLKLCAVISKELKGVFAFDKLALNRVRTEAFFLTNSLLLRLSCN